MMSLLGAAYVITSLDEAEQEKKQKEKERINELKSKVFFYAIRHHMLYNEVVQKINNKELSFEEIDKDEKDSEKRL